MVINRGILSQIVSIVVTVSGIALATAAFVPALSAVSNHLLFAFIISVHLQPWFRDSNLWIRRLSVGGLVVYLLTLVFESLAALIIIPVITTLAVLWGGMLLGTNSSTDKPTQPELQMPKPASKRGAAVASLNYIGSQLLALFNPFQLAQMVMQALGLVVVLVRCKGKLPVADNYAQKVEYCLPVQGKWFVANGGITKETSHSWDVFNQRYAYDLVIVDDQLATHNGDGKSCFDYYCYRKSIIAPADGKVVQVNDGVRDATKPGTMALDFLARDFRGNFIVIKHCDQEYSFLAHFIPGSIKVKVGDMVEQGQFLGECGNSGHSTEPHLHFHVQDRASFFLGMGLPVKFSELEIDGRYQRRSYLSKGESVSN